LPSEASQVYTRLDAGLARVGSPCEKGTPLKLEVNFHNTICGDLEFHECLGGKGGVVRERVVEKNVVQGEISIPSSPSASEGIPDREESEEEEEASETVESDGGEKEEEDEEEPSGQERWVGSKGHRRGGAGGVGGEEKLGGQQVEEGSKRRRRIGRGICGGPAKGEQGGRGEDDTHTVRT